MEMIINKIKLLAKNNDIPISKLCIAIDITEQGLYKMFRTKSLKVNTLFRIAEYFNVPITDFFIETGLVNNYNNANDSNKSMVMESQVGIYNAKIEKIMEECSNCVQKQKVIDTLNKLVDRLETENERLSNQINNPISKAC